MSKGRVLKSRQRSEDGKRPAGMLEEITVSMSRGILSYTLSTLCFNDVMAPQFVYVSVLHCFVHASLECCLCNVISLNDAAAFLALSRGTKRPWSAACVSPAVSHTVLCKSMC